MRAPRRTARAALSPVLLAAALIGCSACGSAHRGASRARTATAAGVPAVFAPVPAGPALGLTEDDADLLWNPARDPGGAFAGAREQLTALHPSYVRVLIDWAALQPSASSPPALGAPASGCARGVGPCGAYAGIRGELEAIASQQRAAAGRGEAAFGVVIDIFGVPAWAAAEPSGCELPRTAAFARALRPGALASYRALIGSLLALASSEGVALPWWSPWNEPNDPRFMSPQHASCSPASPSSSARTYGELAQAMAAELSASGGIHAIILGELDGLTLDSPHATSIARFVAELPAQSLCLGGVWSVHAYAGYGGATQQPEPVQALESALATRGGCAASAKIWVTEAGAGAPHAGAARTLGAGPETEGCLALARELARWYANPRIGAIFQYTFREDPDFQVGLVSADLTHTYPTYRLWLDYSRARAAGEAPPAAAAGCAS